MHSLGCAVVMSSGGHAAATPGRGGAAYVLRDLKASAKGERDCAQGALGTLVSRLMAKDARNKELKKAIVALFGDSYKATEVDKFWGDCQALIVFYGGEKLLSKLLAARVSDLQAAGFMPEAAKEKATKALETAVQDRLTVKEITRLTDATKPGAKGWPDFVVANGTEGYELSFALSDNTSRQLSYVGVGGGGHGGVGPSGLVMSPLVQHNGSQPQASGSLPVAALADTARFEALQKQLADTQKQLAALAAEKQQLQQTIRDRQHASKRPGGAQAGAAAKKPKDAGGAAKQPKQTAMFGHKWQNWDNFWTCEGCTKMHPDGTDWAEEMPELDEVTNPIIDATCWACGQETRPTIATSRRQRPVDIHFGHAVEVAASNDQIVGRMDEPKTADAFTYEDVRGESMGFRACPANTLPAYVNKKAQAAADKEAKAAADKGKAKADSPSPVDDDEDDDDDDDDAAPQSLLLEGAVGTLSVLMGLYEKVGGQSEGKPYWRKEGGDTANLYIAKSTKFGFWCVLEESDFVATGTDQCFLKLNKDVKYPHQGGANWMVGDKILRWKAEPSINCRLPTTGQGQGGSAS